MSALLSINVTLAGATQVTTTRTPVQQIMLTPAAHDYQVGTSNVATIPGMTVKTSGTAPVSMGGNNPVMTFDLQYMYLKGTDGDVIQVLAVTY